MCITGRYLNLETDAAKLWPSSEVERMRRRLGAHETLFLEGDARKHVYIVEKGWVKLYRTLIDGQRQVVGFHDHGAILGLEGAAEHANSCETVTPVTLRAIPIAQLGDLMNKDANFASRMLQQISAQLGTAQSHLTTVGAQSAEQKLATFLLAMADHDVGEAEFDLPMRRTDMGEFLGLRLETISRKMAEFQRRKWIRMVDMYRCRILNRDILQALAEGGSAEDVAHGRLLS